MKFNGVLFVSLAAISYGFPATLMKLALQNSGTNLYVITLFMFLAAMIIMNGVTLLTLKTKGKIKKLYSNYLVMLSGGSIGLTNIFYFSSLNYISVSLAAVMLMQSVWIAILIHSVLSRKWPSIIQIIGIIGILVGTLLATNIMNSHDTFSPLGIMLGLCSGICYAFTLEFTKLLAINITPLHKSSLMSIGSFIFVGCYFLLNPSIFELPDLSSLIPNIGWASLISIFSVIIPLTLLSYGMPKVSGGIGEILSSLELPSAIVFSWLFLNEILTFSQFVGVIIILIFIVIVNLQNLFKKNSEGRIK